MMGTSLRWSICNFLTKSLRRGLVKRMRIRLFVFNIVQASAVFKRNDQDRDGMLSKEEYVMMMKNKKQVN